MKRSALHIAVTAILGWVAPALGAGETPVPPQLSWTFQGPFGKFDQAQLQRGFQIYREVCQACHGLQRLAFRNLSEPGGPGFSPSQVQALAAEYKIKDGPNDSGEMFERPGRPADRFPWNFPNEQAAAAANGGKAPPDLSLMVKARTFERGFPWFIWDALRQYSENGADYLVALLTGYKDAPPGVNVPPGGFYNDYYPGHIIAMPPPLSDDRVEYAKGADGKPVVPQTVEQYAKDITAFLTWAAEPHLEARKRMGFTVIGFLILLTALMYFTKKRVWAAVGGEIEDRPGVKTV